MTIFCFVEQQWLGVVVSDPPHHLTPHSHELQADVQTCHVVQCMPLGRRGSISTSAEEWVKDESYKRAVRSPNLPGFL